MEKSQKSRLIKITLLILIFTAVLAKPIYTIISNRENLSQKEMVDYKNLFDKKAWSGLRLFNTVESKLREPESQYIYNNEYNVFVTKVHISDSLNLEKAVTFKNEVSKIVRDEVYFSIRSFNSEIHIKSGKLPLTNNIELKIDGNLDTVSMAKNQASFYLKFKTSSIVFNNDQSYIVLETDKPNTSAAISLIKKGNLLYIVMMTIDKDKVEMGPKELIAILDK